ncbi:hypothetical protein [endosymbiont GvMRE of Glomus versiforme]|uniref:hypothetical protein n=1 Tax=endosymbiont GvMRE of Glomus versiforme TaxID=2039283 RepID=UPI000EEDA9FD|nr:hypothetical protein [endosymbiont GvMRE of Glomus versiforme]RHZ36432.1 hypothetical protein GvMRE_Ic1g164 [endosymbiont GvMRE of Glomus versiforme]
MKRNKNDSTKEVGGDNSWWSYCNLFTSAIEAGGGGVDQWRTREMKMSSPEAAQKTRVALANEEYNGKKIIVLNGWGLDTDNAKVKKRKTIRIIDENLSIWRNRNEFTLIDEDISI